MFPLFYTIRKKDGVKSQGRLFEEWACRLAFAANAERQAPFLPITDSH
jgi:hypothetical protein